MLSNFTRKAIVYFFAFAFLQSSYGQGLKIVAGANVVVNNAGNIVINNGALSNDGIFTPGTGTITLTGTASSATTSIGGTSSLALYNLIVNKSAGNASLSGNIAVSNNVSMVSNNLDLNRFDLNLGTTGFITGEGANAYITSSSSGFLIRTMDLNAPTSINPGNIGIEITSGANLGTTTIKRGHQQQVSSSGFSIKRFFDFLPANNIALNATVKFNYLDAELSGISEGELKQWSSSSAGATWTLLGADAQDATANFVTKHNINVLNRITLASSVSNPLPLQLLAFSGQFVNNNVLLTWSTAYQINSDYFELQQSVDGRNFNPLARVAAASTSGTPRTYNYTDRDPFLGIKFYRLRMVDRDGSFTYSKVVVVNKESYTNVLVNAYPNPTSGPVKVRFISTFAAKVILQIIDANGTTILNREFTAQKGLNEINYNLSNLAQGSYFIKLVGIDNNKTIKIFKD